MTALLHTAAERMAIEEIAVECERQRIIKIVREGKGRFVNRDWLIRQIEKSD